jgi:uncharacterized phage protein gp47/JayE
MTAPAPSLDELYNDAKAEAVLRRPDLTYNEGDISDMITAAIAAVGDRLVGYYADLTRATFVDGARGADLTKLASDHWNLTRFPAVQAIGSVTFTRTSTVGVATVPAGTVVATERDSLGVTVEYTTDDLLSLGGGVASGSVDVTAVVGGLAGNVQASQIVRIPTVIAGGFTWSVTNAAAIIGGAEEESDDELRERIRTYTTTIRRGTLSALEYGAKQVPQVKQATAVEDSSGNVVVYVTDADGSSNAAMVSDVLDELEEWRAAGANVTVSGGSLYELNPIEITLTVRSGVDTAAIAADVKAAIVARVARLCIGETCSRSIIQQAALNVDTDNITACTVVLPAADVEPTASQIIRTDDSYITVA